MAQSQGHSLRLRIGLRIGLSLDRSQDLSQHLSLGWDHVHQEYYEDLSPLFLAR